MYCNGSKCFLISIKCICYSDIPGVLESVFDRFNVESVIISRRGPVSSFKDIHLSSNQFNSDPDHIHHLLRGGP